jgi:WS/DGAT/MGAT family acyltransferase
MLEQIINPGLEPMDSTDVAWLRMDSDTNLMVVTSVMLLSEPVTLSRLRRTVETRFLVLKRFRQRIVRHLAGASYETDPEFDITRHVTTVPPGTVRGKKGLQQLVGRMATAPLDQDRPLWQMHLVPHYRGGSAIILRIHHCYADGIAMIQVLLAMTDTARDAPVSGKPLARRSSPTSHGLIDSIGTPLERVAGATLQMTADLWTGSMHALGHPAEAMDMAAMAADTLGELVKTVLLPSDAPSRLHRELSGVKNVAWAEPMPLDKIKLASKALGCTINDVLVSCATGALRSYLVSVGDDVDELEFRAEIPVNVRPPDQDFTRLGNQFGLVLLDLPIRIGNPFERLFEVHRRMEELKRSRQALAAYLMLNVMGRLPEAVEKPMLQFFTTKATTVMTNVPGPREPLYFAGSELAQLLFWVPQAGSVGIGISIFSYRGEVQIGLIADENLLPDPESVVNRFGSEFEALASRIRPVSAPHARRA